MTLSLLIIKTKEQFEWKWRYKMITMIACVDKNMGLGKDNRLLVHLPKDLQHFKKTTMGYICVFGRKTFESLPVKPLPNRKNVVLTRDPNWSHVGCVTVNNIDKVLDMSKNYRVFICGGGKVYEQFMPFADELIISHVNGYFEADTFFPTINEIDWIPYHFENVKDNVDFKIVKYKKR